MAYFHEITRYCQNRTLGSVVPVLTGVYYMSNMYTITDYVSQFLLVIPIVDKPLINSL